MTHKKNWIVFFLVVLSLGVAVIGSRLSSGSATHVSLFNLVPFYLNYQEMGFIRRGFVGSFVHLFGLQSPNAITVIAYAQIAIAAAAFWGWVIAYQKNIANVTWFYAVCLLSPAIFLHFGFDLGRPDSLNLAMLILALYLVTKNHYLPASIILSMGILIHEVFLFSCLPVVLFFVFYQSKSLPVKNIICHTGVVALPPVLTNVLLLILGSGSVDMQQANESIAKYVDPRGTETYYLQFTSIAWNVASSFISFYGSLWLNIYHLVLLFVYILLLYFYLKKLLPFKQDRIERLFIAVCFSPLLILLIATDKGRWFAMAIANLFIILPYLNANFHYENIKLNKWISIVMILIGIVLGPMTISGFHFASIFNWVFHEPGHRYYGFIFKF